MPQVIKIGSYVNSDIICQKWSEYFNDMRFYC